MNSLLGNFYDGFDIPQTGLYPEVDVSPLIKRDELNQEIDNTAAVMGSAGAKAAGLVDAEAGYQPPVDTSSTPSYLDDNYSDFIGSSPFSDLGSFGNLSAFGATTTQNTPGFQGTAEYAGGVDAEAIPAAQAAPTIADLATTA